MQKDSTANKIKGCTAENFAVYHYQKKGFYVFKACQTNGPVDIITVCPETFNIQCIDIKTRRYRKDGTKIHNSPRSKQGNIKVVYYEGGKLVESKKPNRK